MKLKVKVITGSKKEDVEQERDSLKVHLTAFPIKGKANKALIELLSRHFKVKKAQIKIIRGLTSNLKEVEVIKNEKD